MAEEENRLEKERREEEKRRSDEERKSAKKEEREKQNADGDWRNIRRGTSRHMIEQLCIS